MVTNSKGQMKIQQMAFVLIALTILFALVGLFFAGDKIGNINQKKETVQENNALRLAATIANAPEFSCGSAYGKTRVNCIDLDKIMALKTRIDLYEDFWGVGGITIIKTAAETNAECTFEEYQDCGVFNVLEGSRTGRDYVSYVSLCGKERGEVRVYDKCEIAKLIVRVDDAN